MTGKDRDVRVKHITRDRMNHDKHVKEIKTKRMLNENCLLRGGNCAIVFLKADSLTDLGRGTHKTELALIRHIDEETKHHSAIHYMWINATCHPETVEIFGVHKWKVPTIAFLNPSTLEYSFQVGRFDK